MHLRGSTRDDMAMRRTNVADNILHHQQRTGILRRVSTVADGPQTKGHANMANKCLLLAVIEALASFSGPALHAHETALETP